MFGLSRIPLYVLNVTYPLIDAEVVRFCAGKKAILLIEEGQPDFIEQAINTILRRADLQTRVEGKGPLPMAGEYTGAVLKDGLRQFLSKHRPDLLPAAELATGDTTARPASAASTAAGHVHPRPPSFCTGCPERPIFAAMKLVERELGRVTSAATSVATCSRSCRRSTSAITPWGTASAVRAPRR